MDIRNKTRSGLVQVPVDYGSIRRPDCCSQCMFEGWGLLHLRYTYILGGLALDL